MERSRAILTLLGVGGVVMLALLAWRLSDRLATEASRTAQATRVFQATLSAVPTATPTPEAGVRGPIEVSRELQPLVERLESQADGWEVVWADRLSQQIAVAAVPPAFESGDELLPGLELIWEDSQPFFRKVRGGEDLPASETEVGTVTVFLLREFPDSGEPGRAFMMVAMNQFYVFRYLHAMDTDRALWDRGQFLQTYREPLLINGIDWNAVRILLPGRVFPSWSRYPDIPR